MPYIFKTLYSPPALVAFVPTPVLMARVRIRIRVRVRAATIGFRKNPQTTRFGALHTTIGVTETLIFFFFHIARFYERVAGAVAQD